MKFGSFNTNLLLQLGADNIMRKSANGTNFISLEKWSMWHAHITGRKLLNFLFWGVGVLGLNTRSSH